MKKTVTINLNGIVYHIDDDAYEILHSYLQTLHQHFSNEDSADEILHDIETRISELLQLKIKNQFQVITTIDVNEVIAIMGTPKDFGINSDEAINNEKTNNSENKKRIYRDFDGRILGGVCSGIAYYFNTDVTIVRLLFALTFFIAGPLIYIIAWIIIPRAETTYQKVEMRGDAVDIESIKNRVKEEFSDVKSRFSEFSHSFKNSSESKKKTKQNIPYYRNSQTNNSHFFISIGGYMFRTIFFFIGLIILAFFIALIVGFSLNWFSFSNFSTVFPSVVSHWVHYIFSSHDQANLAIIGIFILIFLPLVLIVWGLISAFLGIKKNSKIIGFLVFVIWFSALCMVGISVYSVVKDFSKKELVTTKYYSKPKATKEFIISIHNLNSQVDCSYVPKQVHACKQWAFIDCLNKLYVTGIVDYSIETSLQDSVSVTVFASSYGKNNEQASQIAKDISIQPKLTDSTLEFPKFFVIENPSQWRNQKITILVTIPQKLRYTLINKSATLD